MYVVFLSILAFISFSFIYDFGMLPVFRLLACFQSKAKEKVKKAGLTTWFFTFCAAFDNAFLASEKATSNHGKGDVK